MRPFKISLSVEWCDRDVEMDTPDIETTGLESAGWATYEPDQLALAVMLVLPELVRELTQNLVRHTGERPANEQMLDHARRAAANGNERASSLLRHIAEYDPTVGAAPASETTGDAPSAEELTAMWDASPPSMRAWPDVVLTDDVEPEDGPLRREHEEQEAEKTRRAAEDVDLPRCTICGAVYSNLVEHMREAH